MSLALFQSIRLLDLTSNEINEAIVNEFANILRLYNNAEDLRVNVDHQTVQLENVNSSVGNNSVHTGVDGEKKVVEEGWFGGITRFFRRD